MFKNILLVGSITLLIKGLGFYKETVVASNFGLSLVLDTFFIAFLVPGFIQHVFLGAFKNVFIPNYIAESRSKNRIASFQSTGFLVTGLVSFIFILIAFLFTDTFLQVFFAGHEESFYTLVRVQFHILLPCILFWGFSSLLSGLLNINEEFKYSSFESVFIPIAIIVCLLFFKERFGPSVLATGTLIGSICSFSFLLFVCLKKNILKIDYPNFRSKNAQLMFRQIPAKVSSGFLTGLNGVVDQFFAAQLVVGSVAALNYGLKLPAFLMGILVIALTNVLLPQFSNMIIDDREKAYRFFYKTLTFLFLGTIFFSVIGIVLSDFLVALFFERNEFTSEDTAVVSRIQKIFLIYTPFAICGMVIVSFLTSMNKNAIMAYVSLGAFIANTVLDYLLIKRFGVFGIAICTTVVIVIKNIFLLVFAVKIQNRKKPAA